MFSEDFEESDNVPLLLNRGKDMGKDNKRKRNLAVNIIPKLTDSKRAYLYQKLSAFQRDSY